MATLCLLILASGSVTGSATAAEDSVTLRMEVVDEQTGCRLPARVYVRAQSGRWYFARCASAEGSAVAYRKERQPGSLEMHTTVSAHPFEVAAPPGRYEVTVERGKEYFPVTKRIELGPRGATVKFTLRRWIDMAAAGWYSGDTHVHRSIEELPNVMLAEDVNVGLPLPYWVTTAYTAPRGDTSRLPVLKPEPIHVDATHVIYPINTEYEIFRVGDREHTLGAVFALGHQMALRRGVPPVQPVAEEAHRQGALLDLDKHSWPWSLMLVPVMQIDLFELANNHCWRTRFGFRRWSIDTVPSYMNLQQDEDGLTEWGWIDFGLQTYYALLNCGFRLKPSAGTASGVHPVPLGFGRVYVHLPQGFSYRKWMQGLAAGRSFVTTGPMLMVLVDGHCPGAVVRKDSGESARCRITGTAIAAQPLQPLEVIVNGRAAQRLPAANRRTPDGAYQSPVDAQVELPSSGWIAVRVREDRPDGRVRFAHSSPVHIELPGKPLRPRPEETAYLIQQVRGQLRRNQGILRPEELDEYRQALAVYEEIAERALP